MAVAKTGDNIEIQEGESRVAEIQTPVSLSNVA